MTCVFLDQVRSLGGCFRSSDFRTATGKSAETPRHETTSNLPNPEKALNLCVKGKDTAFALNATLISVVAQFETVPEGPQKLAGGEAKRNHRMIRGKPNAPRTGHEKRCTKGMFLPLRLGRVPFMDAFRWLRSWTRCKLNHYPYSGRHLCRTKLNEQMVMRSAGCRFDGERELLFQFCFVRRLKSREECRGSGAFFQAEHLEGCL